MYQKSDNRLSIYLNIVLISVLSAINLLWTASIAEARQAKTPKIIVYIVDDLDLKDISHPKLANFQKAIRSGAVGLMNTRTGNLAVDNKSSAYLTIGMGTRVTLTDDRFRAMNSEPVLRANMREADKYPLYNVIGQSTAELNRKLDNYRSKGKLSLGEVARKNNKIIGLIESGDRVGGHWQTCYASLLTGSGSGKIGIGNVNTNPGQLADLSRKAIHYTDILFVDFGSINSLSKIKTGKEQNRTLSSRQQLMERADWLLGNLLQICDSGKAVLFIVSPMSKTDTDVTAFKNLAPVVMYGKGVNHGILTSGTTRRAGLVSNIDITPSILKSLGINPKRYGYIGEPLHSIGSSQNLSTVRSSLDRLIHLKVARYVIHGFYVLLLMVFILTVVHYIRKGTDINHKRIFRTLALMILSIPVLSMVIPLIVPYPGYLDIVLTLTAIITVGITCSTTVNKTLDCMAAASFAVVLFMITDLLMGRGNLLNTPLGFNDVFSGGRYYGLNNDVMGILLGAAVFSSFYLSERFGFNRIKTMALVAAVLTTTSLSLMPDFGANVGGTIAALTIGLVAAIFLLSRKGVNSSRFIGIIVVVILMELVISYTDTLSGSQTHAGKALTALMSGNTIVNMIDIIKSKLKVFGIMLIIPPWNLLLLAQLSGLFVLYKKRLSKVEKLKLERPMLSISFMVIFYGALAAFIFNDTGVIATALMLTYVTMPLGVLESENYNLGEYDRHLSQKI